MVRPFWRIAQCTPRRPIHSFQRARYSSASSENNSTPASADASDELDVEEFLSRPTWSVSSLLPDHGTDKAAEEITPGKLRHLLRLAALAEPQTKQEETQMLLDLASQLHFVKQMQQVNVEGIEPLQAIRDETEAGQREAEITIAKVQETLSQEEVVGRFYPRLRRRNDPLARDEETPANWRPLQHASRTVDKYFVVEKVPRKKG